MQQVDSQVCLYVDIVLVMATSVHIELEAHQFQIDYDFKRVIFVKISVYWYVVSIITI